MFNKNRIIQHIFLLGSPVLIIPTVLKTVEQGFDYYYNNCVLTKKYKKTKGKITGAGIVQVNRKNQEISIDEKGDGGKFIPKLEYVYNVNNKYFRSTFGYYKRKRYKTYEDAKNFLTNTIESLKKKRRNKNIIDVIYSKKDNHFARIVPSGTKVDEMKILGYSKEENIQSLKKNSLYCFGLSSLLGISYFTSSPMAKMMGRKIIGYGILINIVIIGITMRKNYKENFFNLRSKEIQSNGKKIDF